MKVDTLPKEYRELFKLRLEEQRGLGIEDNDSPNNINAIIWDNTPEGHTFWAGVYRANHIAELPPIPENSKFVMNPNLME